MSAPTATVLLPLFEAEPIAWLALESLCRQKTNHKWELIVAEEQRKRNTCGREYIEDFLPRLKKAGMVRFEYIGLHRRISLGEKWRMMAWLVSPSSKVSLLQAADCYSEPHRITTAVKSVESGFDWVHSPKGVFYHIGLDKAVLYEAATIKNKKRLCTHLNMALRSDLLRLIHHKEVHRGVDGYLYRELDHVKRKKEKKPIKVFTDSSSNWKKGVDTHGFNNISIKRGNKFERVVTPFVNTNLTIDKVVPKEISARLKALQSKLKKAA
jgi:hypothetical protein